MQDNVQFIIILVAVILGAILVARFWRTILKWLLLVIGVILIIGIVGLWLKNGTTVPQVGIQPPEDAGGVVETIAGLLDLAGAILPRSEPACPTPTYAAPAGPSFGEVLLLVLLVLALGGAGYFWLRWRIAGRGDGILPRPRRRRQRRPAYDQQPVIYVVPEYEEYDEEGDAGEADGYVGVGADLSFLGDLDPGLWGF